MSSELESCLFGPAELEPRVEEVAPDAEGYRSGFVAVVGKPNVGKSTLLNRLVGEKVAITSPKPQTTRRRILGIRTTASAQAIFVDTPGLHVPKTALGESMVRVVRAAIPDADVALAVVDVSKPPEDRDLELAKLLRQSGRPVLLVLNKSDLLKPEDVEARSEAFREHFQPTDWLLSVATKGHNLPLLWRSLIEHLPPGPPLYPPDQITDQSERAWVSELIREAALRYLQQEVPHGLEVLIEDWERREDGLLGIAAKIFVERDTHKGIVIGKGGAMLKKIGTAARREIERSLGEQVFLEMFVSVKPGWRRSAVEVQRMGFQD